LRCHRSVVSIIDTNAGQPDAYGAGNCAGRTAEAQRLFMAESVALTARREISSTKPCSLRLIDSGSSHPDLFLVASVRGWRRISPKTKFPRRIERQPSAVERISLKAEFPRRTIGYLANRSGRRTELYAAQTAGTQQGTQQALNTPDSARVALIGTV
jgi:hypothetical protein